MTTFINLFGGPGTGKSTAAAEIFAIMKAQNKSVELVTEVAKDFTWENRQDTLAIQPYVSMKQYRNLQRVNGKVEYVVTDSPLLKDKIYADLFAPTLPGSYWTLLEDLHNDLGKHINILLTRNFEYAPEGRNQTLQEAKNIDERLASMLRFLRPFITTASGAKHQLAALGIINL